MMGFEPMLIDPKTIALPNLATSLRIEGFEPSHYI